MMPILFRKYKSQSVWRGRKGSGKRLNGNRFLPEASNGAAVLRELALELRCQWYKTTSDVPRFCTPASIFTGSHRYPSERNFLMQNRKTILPVNSQATELNSRKKNCSAERLDVHAMSRDDLIQTIIRCNVPFVQESNLQKQETEVLRRLTSLAINHCNDLA